MMSTRIRIAVAAVFSLALGACSGGRHASALPSAPVQSAGLAKSAATLSIRIPKATQTAGGTKPAYVSPATTQMTLDIQQGGVSITGYPTTVALTPTSAGCSSTLASTLCQLTLSLAPGNYVASLTLLDASSTALSAVQNVAFTVTAGTANAINVSLSGIPHSIVVSPGTYAVTGTQNAGMTLYGAAAQHLIVNALDGDGNIIIGPGAPTFTATVQSGTGWSTTAPAASTPNTLTVTPPGSNGSFASLAVTAAYPDATCSLSGAVCSTTVGIKNDVQRLYVLNFGTPAVTGYTLPATTGASPSIAAFNGGHFSNGFALVLNSSNDVFVADPTVAARTGTNAVYEYTSSGAYVTSIPSTSGVNQPWGLAVDRTGDLFVANLGGKNVTEYPPPYTTSTPITLSKGTSGSAFTFGAGGLTFDSNGNLFIETENTLYTFGPPFATANNATAQQSLGNYGTPLAIDQANNIYAIDTNGKVLKLEPPLYAYYASPTLYTTTSPGPIAMSVAADANGNVFVAVCGACGGSSGDSIKEYSASGTLLASFSSGLSDPYAMAIDGAGNLYVSNCPTCSGLSGTGNVVMYSPPFSNSSVPAATLNDASINGPTALAITP